MTTKKLKYKSTTIYKQNILLSIKINRLKLTKKLVSKLRIFSKIDRFNKEQIFDKTVKLIENRKIIDKNSNYKRIVNKSVVSFLKRKYLIQVLSS